MSLDVTTEVLDNRDLGHGNLLLEFAAPSMTREMEPGQFFMIGIPGAETLLRRPFSVCGLRGTFEGRGPDRVQILYKIYGSGTRLLGSLKAGSPITVLGPLGRGFAPPEPARRPVLVAGGIGSAPFPAWIARLRALGTPTPRMFYGARSHADLPLAAWFAECTDGLDLATEDGSAGRRGLVTAPFAEFLDRSDPRGIHVYACGPQPMLQAVARIARERGLRCDLALEAHMACGFGVCLGCVVPTRRPGSDAIQYERVCVEGPVMPAEVLAW